MIYIIYPKQIKDSRLVKMNSTLIEEQNQIKLGVFGNYFFRLKIGTMLNKSGIMKTKGASPLELFII